MSVLFDVIDKMMADFLSKEEQWKRYRDLDRMPAPFALTLDTPDMRQLRKELDESVFTTDMAGIGSYRRRLVDGVPYEAPYRSDDTMRTIMRVSVLYPYPADQYVHSATIQHNCTLPALVPGALSEPQRRDLFFEEDRRLGRANVATSERPGYVVNSACNCVDCRFSRADLRNRNNENGPSPTPPPGIQPLVDAWDDEVRRNREAMELSMGGISGWPPLQVQALYGMPIQPPPPPAAPVPTTPSHPNDPRPRMPRLSDGTYQRRVPSPETQAAVLRDIWGGRPRF